MLNKCLNAFDVVCTDDHIKWCKNLPVKLWLMFLNKVLGVMLSEKKSFVPLKIDSELRFLDNMTNLPGYC